MASKQGRAPADRGLGEDRAEAFIVSLFANDLHAKRVLSLSNAVVGVLRSASLGIHAIGRGLAAVRGTAEKHAVKQVDRLLSNPGLNVPTLAALWVRFVVAERTEIFANLDWTEFDNDNHSMLVLSLQSRHGRSLPLLWKTVLKSKLKDRRNQIEDDLLRRLRDAIGENCRVTIVADRGFGDHKLYAFLKDELKFE
jgi:hypothetical protein